MKPAYIMTLILILSAVPAQAVDCRDVYAARQEYRRLFDGGIREINKLEQEKIQVEHELAMIDGDTTRTLAELQKESDLKEAVFEQSIVERQYMGIEYLEQVEELKNGLYCSKCNRSKSQIEKMGRESFTEHIRNVKSHQLKAPSEAFKALYADYNHRRNESFKKTTLLRNEYEKVGDKMSQVEDAAKNRKQILQNRISEIPLDINSKSKATAYKLTEQVRIYSNSNCP